MRQILLGLFFLLLTCPCFGGVIHIPADVDTFAHAKQTCTATTTPGIVQIDANTSEQYLFNSSAIGTVQGANRGITINGGIGSAVTFNSTALTFPVTIKNISIVSNTNFSLIVTNTVGKGFGFYFDNIYAENNGGGSVILVGTIPGNAGDYTIINSTLYGKRASSGNADIKIASNCTVSASIRIINSKLKPSFNGIKADGGTSANPVFSVLNCDIHGCSRGVTATMGMGVTNTLLFLNTIDDTLSLGANISYFQNCGFGTRVSGAGTGCVYGLTTANTFCDPNNYWLSPDPLVMNGGVSINGITNSLIGLNEVKLGGSGVIEMGCMGYSPAFCGSGMGVGNGK
jgi:hypothetical protein